MEKTYEELVTEVQENVEIYYDDPSIEPQEITRKSVEDALYSPTVADEEILDHWHDLVRIAVQRFEQLTELDGF